MVNRHASPRFADTAVPQAAHLPVSGKRARRPLRIAPATVWDRWHPHARDSHPPHCRFPAALATLPEPDTVKKRQGAAGKREDAVAVSATAECLRGYALILAEVSATGRRLTRKELEERRPHPRPHGAAR